MVLMGSALALHCGGMSVRRVGDQEGTGGTDATGDSGKGGTGGSNGTGTVGKGGTTATGSGGGPMSTGGSGGTHSGSGGSTPALGGTGGSIPGGGMGGSVHAGSGGSSGMSSGAAGVPSVRQCRTSQWECDPITCAGGQYASPEHCECDAERPESAEDCEPGQAFVCHAGGATADGVPTILFSCSCMTPATDCNATCRVFAPQATCLSESQSPGEHTVLCGCLISLR